MLQDAIDDLYEHFPFQARLRYSNRFKPYNANVQLKNNCLTFNLSSSWKPISREIQIGLIHELLLKILKKRLKPRSKETTNMQLYSYFMQKIHIAIPKTKTDAALEQVFNKVNDDYFSNMIETPNLRWNHNSINKLGSYEFGTDTITISSILKGHPKLLEYVMYHEMLHKKQKFYTKNGRTFHHTKRFKKKEREFADSELLEKELSRLVRKRKFKPNFFRKL